MDTLALILSRSSLLFPFKSKYSGAVKTGVPFEPLVVEKLPEDETGLQNPKSEIFKTIDGEISTFSGLISR